MNSLTNEALTMTPTEAAKALKISKPTVYALIHRKGGIPHFRIGRKIVIPRNKFNSWINDCTLKTE